MNIDYEEYSYPRMETLLKEINGKSCKEQVELTIASVKDFVGKAEQSDDITLLVIRRKE